MRKVSFALALIAVLGFGSLFIEAASAQNTNSSTTMNANMHSTMGGRRRHRKHRRHRRHKMKHKMNMEPTNKNQ
jgi:hypothetical protein